jgi:hypothetical protein
MRPSAVELIRRTAIIVAVVLVPVLIWAMFDVILMAMGAVIIAILLRLGAEPFLHWLKLPERVALAISGLLIIVCAGAAAFLFGTSFCRVPEPARSSRNRPEQHKITFFGLRARPTHPGC